jgi:hypothetical protein
MLTRDQPSIQHRPHQWALVQIRNFIMTVTLHLRSFTGKLIFVEVDPDGRVSDAKVAIARVLSKEVLPRLSYKGHELRDHQNLSYYCDPSRDVLHIRERQRICKAATLT